MLVDSRSVVSSVESEESRHESARHGFHSADREVQNVISGWAGLGSRVFGGHWDNTGGNLLGVLDKWSARNGNTRASMGEYCARGGESADGLEAASDEIAAVMAKIDW